MPSAGHPHLRDRECLNPQSSPKTRLSVSPAKPPTLLHWMEQCGGGGGGGAGVGGGRPAAALEVLKLYSPPAGAVFPSTSSDPGASEKP